MSYSDFTIDDLKQKLELQLIENRAMYSPPPEYPVSDLWLRFNRDSVEIFTTLENAICD